MGNFLIKRAVSRELARTGIDRAVQVSIDTGCVTCIAVLDGDGQLVSYDRMDGAPFQSAQLARDKAYSVAGNGTANHDFWDMIKDQPWLVNGVQKVRGLVVLGGGIPIVYEGELIGAVGVSGKSNMDEDRAIAEAAVAAILDAIHAN